MLQSIVKRISYARYRPSVKIISLCVILYTIQGNYSTETLWIFPLGGVFLVAIAMSATLNNADKNLTLYMLLRSDNSLAFVATGSAILFYFISSATIQAFMASLLISYVFFVGLNFFLSIPIR